MRGSTQADPADIKSVCGDGAQKVKSYMSNNCGDNLDAANSAFAEVCKSAGVTVCKYHHPFDARQHVTNAQSPNSVVYQVLLCLADRFRLRQGIFLR